MNRIFHNPKVWEDYRNGMYELKCEIAYTKKLNKSKYLLSTPYMFFEIGSKMVNTWIYSAEHNLTNFSRNRQAWVGQASCCYFCGAPEFIVKEAWRLLDDKQKNKANLIADEIIKKFIKRLNYKNQLSWENIF